MIGLAKVTVCILVTTLGLALFTRYEGSSSATRLLGTPLVSVAQKGPRGLIAIGQEGAVGVIVVAQAGFGLVTFAQGGVGLLFGVGQGIAGLIVFAQVGLGLLFFLGQLGFGLQALGQLAGIGRPYLAEMSAEFNQLLALRRPSGGG